MRISQRGAHFVSQHLPEKKAAMLTCRGFLLLLGFVESMFLIMLFLHQWDMFEVHRDRLQELRQQALKETCDVSQGKRRLEDLSGIEMKNFLVDDEYGVIYCYVPKVACTNWKRVMFVLKQGEPYQDPMSISRQIAHDRNNLTLLSSFPRTEIKAKLKHYTKFMFVRDPFVRLISAYRDKLEHSTDYNFESYARNILRLYGKQPTTASGVRPSFNNFIQYLVDPQTEKNGPFEPHWRQMHRLCLPCLIQYDFIGHQETLQEDAEQLLKILKLEKDIKFPPSYQNMTSPDSVLDWFRTVPLEDRKKLYKVYEQDFRLFGYRRPGELLDG